MFIARKLKRENICEYLLYMWQIEDLLRAFNLDAEAVNQRIVAHYPVNSESERKELSEWYESLIEMMRLENIQEKGHLQLNKNIIIELEDFHELILKSGKVPAYNAKFFHVLPFINQFKLKADNNLSDVEQCFNFQYGYLLLRMKKTEISAQTQQTQTEISKFLVLLARNYQLHRNGELDLEE